jgi:tRNA-splicing endonuclease subunit Sen54
VTLARGIHFGSLGHSAPRPVSTPSEATKIHKRLELLPEEALYLVERGTLFITKENNTLKSNIPGMEDIEGAPMSVQQAFAEMIGTEDLSLEKYQVRYHVAFIFVLSLTAVTRFLHI